MAFAMELIKSAIRLGTCSGGVGHVLSRTAISTASYATTYIKLNTDKGMMLK
jgi:hypothetical protein